MVTKRMTVGEQQRMVLNLILNGVKVYLTREGQGVLRGEKVERIPVQGGVGMKITYGAHKREIG